MKRLSTGAALVGFALVACQTAQTQSEPEVVVVPPDEMSRDLSPGQAVSAKPSTLPAGRPQTAPHAILPQPSPATAAPAVKYAYNSCNVAGPYIAITFDDGPSAQLTPRLLDILKERGIKATFFVVGQNAVEYPDIVLRMASEGHEIANHSWSHPALTNLGAESFRKQIAFLGNARATVDFRRIMLKRLTHTGSTLRARAIEDKAAIARALEAKVLPLLQGGKVKPLMDSVYPLIKASEAHARMEFQPSYWQDCVDHLRAGLVRAESLGFPDVSWHLTRTSQGVSSGADIAVLGGTGARHCCVCVRVARGRRLRARRRRRQRPQRFTRDRPHRHPRVPEERHRPHPGFDRARNRRHRPPRRSPRPRRRNQLAGVRARQQHRRPARPPDRRAALPHRLVRACCGPISACRVSQRSRRRPATARSGRTIRSPTSSASRSTRAPSSPSSSSFAPTSCRSSICGSPRPTRTRSTPSRCIRASSSASPDCSRWC